MKKTILSLCCCLHLDDLLVQKRVVFSTFVMFWRCIDELMARCVLVVVVISRKLSKLLKSCQICITVAVVVLEFRGRLLTTTVGRAVVRVEKIDNASIDFDFGVLLCRKDYLLDDDAFASSSFVVLQVLELRHVECARLQKAKKATTERKASGEFFLKNKNKK